jgi:hypothetical protein
MTISLKTVMDNLPPEQRARVEQRAAELSAEEMTLQYLVVKPGIHQNYITATVVSCH